MKKIRLGLASASLFAVFVAGNVDAISLDDIQLWTGSGTNRAAVVIEWSTPESTTNSSVPMPLADKTLVWGYRFNGHATGTQMLNAILAADPRLYVVEDNSWGSTFVEGIGYNLKGDGVIGITDGSATNLSSNGLLMNPTVDVDAAGPINGGDLYWGGYWGPNWETWTELGDAGGFLASPNRGAGAYWTPDDSTDPFSGGAHGQWEFAEMGLDSLPLTNGSWIGFSVAAGEFEYDTNAPCFAHNHAPPSPDGTYAAYVCNTNDFAVQVISSSNIYTRNPYNNPLAVLGRPTLEFIDALWGGTVERTKIVEAPYWTDPNDNDVITEISNGGQITVKLGRKVYDDPNNPYGIDLIVYGNSYLFADSSVDDETDLDTCILAGGGYPHSTTVAVSQDGVNWFSYGSTAMLFPDNSYRWDETNHSWTEEQSNPTKPLNPFLNTCNFGGQSVASALDQFIGAAGGSGYDLKSSGLPWIQYVRITPKSGAYTVIDAIAAVNPVVVGDALSIAPSNIDAGITNLAFQKPADSSENLISINFDSVSDIARISTVSLNDYSPFMPPIGTVSSAYQITSEPVTGNTPITFTADVSLRVGDCYNGNGTDLRVFQWGGTNWTLQPFTYNSTNEEVTVAGVTNFSAFVISQIVPPQLSIRPGANGFSFQFGPVPNCGHVLERSTDLVTWTPIATLTPTNSQLLTLQDSAAPPDKAFYRLRLITP